MRSHFPQTASSSTIPARRRRGGGHTRPGGSSQPPRSPWPAHGLAALIAQVRRRERGTSTLELALVVPLFLMLIVGGIDFGRAIVLTNITSEAAREGARLGKVIVTPVVASPAVAVPATQANAIATAAAYQAAGFAPNLTVTSTTGGDATSGYYVQVSVGATYQPAAGAYLHMGNIPVGATSRIYLP